MGTSISAIITVTTPALGTAPGPATNLTISNLTATSLTLSWSAPATGTTPFTYQAQISISGSGVWTNLGNSTASTSVNATLLQPNTTYLFQVITTNSTSSSTSASVSATTLAIAPGAPTGLAVAGTTQTSITVQWVAPTTGTPPLTYQVFYALGGTGSFTAFSFTTTATSQEITGLSPGTAYDFKVTASNAAGTGPASIVLSNISTQAQTTPVAPSAPLNLAAGTVTPTSIQVSWSPPATGTPPISYIVQWRPH